MTSPQRSLTENLVRLIRQKPITASDMEAASLFVLDAVANALAGANTEPGRIVAQWAQENAPSNPNTIAFRLGAQTHILETDDLHRASVVHPGCIVVPASLALASKKETTGREFLTSVLYGFEATCRVGMAVGAAHYRIWHNTATCGPYGSAMAAAHLLHLDEQSCVHALGNAGTQSSGLWQFMDTGAMTKHLHAGRGAQAGVLAADLARLGFTGPPRILEGEKGFFAAACPGADPGAVIRDPGAPWQLALTSIKPWPSCRHTHPAIDAAQELRKGIDVDAIERIDVEAYQAALDVCDRIRPSSEYEAKFSLQHCVAAALARPAVDFTSFGPDARHALKPLRERAHLSVAEPYRSAYPHAWGSAVTVTLKSGEKKRVTRQHAKGDPDAALSKQDLIAKAKMLLDYGKVEDPQAVVEEILALPTANSTKRTVSRILSH